MFTALHLSLAVAISGSYVALIYVFDFDGNRDDPRSIWRRFISAIVNNVVGISCTYATLNMYHESPLVVMGIRMRGALSAFFLPSLLTSVFFLGNWVMYFIDSNSWTYAGIQAPVTEEVAYRACSATLIRQCFSSTTTVFVSPLLFALSHLHHIFDDIRLGCTKRQAVVKRGFQMLISYCFGAYATFLLIRTGNILAPIVSHAICNSMGIPLVEYIGLYPKQSTRVILWSSQITGFLSWLYLLRPLTDSKLYS